MTREEIVTALRHLMVETGSLACLGCGREHNCSTSGCRIMRCAADLLENDAAREWTPVTERLPSRNGSYIVHCDDSHEPTDERIWGDSVVLAADWYSGAWSWNENGDEYDLEGIVTHWMPLPDAPEVE